MIDRMASPTAQRVRRLRPRAGYVLLVLLAVMMVVVTAVADLTRRTLKDQLAAAEVQRAMQLRWGAHSIAEVLRDELPEIFELRHETWLAEQQNNRLPPERWRRPDPNIDQTVVLGEASFVVRIADESAKVPLNVLHAESGADAIRSVMVESFGPVARQWPLTPLAIGTSDPRGDSVRRRSANDDNGELDRPAASRLGGDDDDSSVEDEEAAEQVPQAFAHWSQLLPTPQMMGVTSPAGASGPSRLPTTVAGPGSPRWMVSRSHSLANRRGVNVSRASPTVLEQTASDVIGPAAAKRLRDRFLRRPTFRPREIVQSEIENPGDARRLQKRFSGASTCFSLLILGRTRPGQRIERHWSWTLDTEGRLSGSVWAF